MKIKTKSINDGVWTGWEETWTFTEEEQRNIERIMQPENLSKMLRDCSIDVPSNKPDAEK